MSYHMKSFLSVLPGVISLVLIFNYSLAQPFTLEVMVKHQPEEKAVLGKVKGDDFIPVDTLSFVKDSRKQHSTLKYSFAKGATTGMYRLILGYTTYAKVMNEAPQQLDFIFNNENLILETDFKEPAKGLLVILSEENRIWYEFLWKEQVLQKQLKELESELDLYRKQGKAEEATQATDQFNQLQNDRDQFISQITQRHRNLYAAKMIAMFREPFVNGYLSRDKRRELFQRDFLSQLNFDDESLINTSVYTDKVFYYLTSYNQPGYTKDQLEEEYIRAMDILLPQISSNPKVYNFIKEYLLHGFKVLKMDKVQDYIKTYSIG